ncbi:MAG TPA: hypothetical protein VKB43_13620 [Gaiellaceae bacterium]|nr:hypothetical protein [Gaiellaceae bacterium]
MKWRAVAILALVAPLAAGCGGGGKPSFQSAAGWQLLSGQNELAAANVPFAAADRSMASPPSRTVAALPRRGVLIWAMVSRSAGPGTTPLPLRLTEAVPSNPFEGFGCAPAVSDSGCYARSGSVRELRAQTGRYAVDLYVFFGTDHPPTASVRAANAELARLQLPHGKETTAPACPVENAYETRLSRSAGPPGSTVTVSGALGVVGEDGTYGGQTAKEAHAYWNLDFHKWWSALGPKPLPAVPGSPVENLAGQDVARRCTYRFWITIPSVRPGSYPIEVLAGVGKSQASFAPVSFRVTDG